MKFLLVLSFFCFLILVSTQSCQKDTDPPVTDTLIISHIDTLYIKDPTSIFGLWVGTYDDIKGPYAGRKGNYYSFELHTDSTIQVLSSDGDGLMYYGTGKWSLQSTSFTAHITTTTTNIINPSVVQTVTGTYDSLHSKLIGTVTNDASSDYEASFNLEKVQ